MDGFWFDLLAALAVLVSSLPLVFLALSYGFAARGAVLGLVAASAGALILGVLSPVAFPAENVVLAGRAGRDPRERISAVVLSGLALGAVGALGYLEHLYAFLGPAILGGLMAGVGVILARVSFRMIEARPGAGLSSLAAALAVQAYTGDLVYTVVLSFLAGALASLLLGQRGPEGDRRAERLWPRRLALLNLRVARGALSLVVLSLGVHLARGEHTAGLAGATVSPEYLAFISGGASVFSGLLGGGPLGPVISATGAAPDPLRSGVLMMGLLALLLLTGLLPRLAPYFPGQCCAGFLFVLGAVVLLPAHLPQALAAEPVVGGVTAAATAAADPATGLVLGLLARALLDLGVGF